MRWIGVVGDADVLTFQDRGWARGNNGNGNEFVFSQELDK